jgi:hypothetical protein
MSTATLILDRASRQSPARETTSVRGPRRWGTVALLPALAGLFLACFVLFRRHNDFPAYYHEDEPGKASQVIDGDRNYNHPQLLLEVTALAAKVLRTPRQVQAVVVLGRSVSAALAALGAVAVAFAAWRWHGGLGLVLMGTLLGLCPALLVYAHYLKEDAALTFGICLTILACQIAWDRGRRGRGGGSARDLWSLTLLGSACGIAIAAKYTGAAVLALALPVAAAAGRGGWRAGIARVLIVLALGVVVCATINYRAMGHLALAASRLQAERYQALHGIWGVRLARPNLYHPAMFVRQTPPVVLLLAGFMVAASLVRPRQFGAELCLALFAGAYLALIACCSMPFNRYVLPVVVLAHVLAALALIRAAQCFTRRGARWTFGAGAVGFLLATLLPRCLDVSAQFGDDGRERLRAWVIDHLPPDAVYLQDGCVALGEPFDPRTGRAGRIDLRIFGSRAYGGGSPAAQGSIDLLRHLGVEYVAVADSNYNFYVDPLVSPSPESAGTFAARRKWYEALFRDEELIWSSIPRYRTWSQYNNPELRLYRLRTEAR